MFMFFCRRLIKVSDPFILQLFHTWLSSWFCDRRPEGTNVTLELLGSRTWHSALRPLRLEIMQAIMSGHWPRLNQRKSRALVYVRVCYADNYGHPVNKSTLGWNEVVCVRVCVCVRISAWESCCVSHQRWRCCRERRIWPKLPLILGVQQGSSSVTCSPVCSDKTNERRERSTEWSDSRVFW